MWGGEMHRISPRAGGGGGGRPLPPPGGGGGGVWAAANHPPARAGGGGGGGGQHGPPGYEQQQRSAASGVQQPLVLTCPWPILNWNGLPLSRLESNLLPARASGGEPWGVTALAAGV